MANAPPTKAKEDKTVTIVVVGRSKAGKSSLLRNVFGPDVEGEEVEDIDCLSEAPGTLKLLTHEVTRDGITLRIVDTIGLSQEKRERRQQLRKLSTHTKKKADLVLFCIPVGPNTRFENNNPELMRALQQCYGQNIWRHCLVVFTFSNLAWDRVKRKEAAEAKTKYIEYITSYTDHFRRELEKMGVEKKITSSVQCIFDVKKDRLTIVTIPAGDDVEDPILPGIDLDEEEKWVGKLFNEMVESAEKESKRAILEFRYTREVVKQAYRRASTKITQTLDDATKTLKDSKVTKTLDDAIKYLEEKFTPNPSQQPPPQTAETDTTYKSTSRTEKPATKSELQPPQAPQTPTQTATATTSTPPSPTHPEVKEFLQLLSSDEIRKVGVNLGLSYPKLKSIAEENMPDEVIHCWLRKDDNVTETSWQKLVEALEKNGFNGVAAKVRQGMQKNIIW